MDLHKSDEEYWDSVAPVYASLYESDWARYEDEQLRADLRELLLQARGKRVLDIGCGTGLAYRLMRETNVEIDYVGLDLSSAMLGKFTEQYPDVETVHSSVDSLMACFPPSHFDLIVATNVSASFWPDTCQTLAEVNKLLVPGGAIHLSFLNRGSLRRILQGRLKKSEAYRTRGDLTTHQFVWATTYRRRELVQLLNFAGFDRIQGCYRSIFGGVWETSSAIKLERALAFIVPWLGHSITMNGIRPE